MNGSLRKLAILALCAGVTSAHAEVVAVVSAQSPIGMLTQAQIADVFLGRLTRLPNGTLAVPLDQPEGSMLRDEFYLRMAGKSPAQLKAFWSKLIFTGRGRPPRALMDSEEILKAVRNNPAAIGYVERNLADGSVRILP